MMVGDGTLLPYAAVAALRNDIPILFCDAAVLCDVAVLCDAAVLCVAAVLCGAAVLCDAVIRTYARMSSFFCRAMSHSSSS
jgi:hypothetical protein